METTFLIVIVTLALITMVESKGDVENIVVNMVERLTMAEEKMIKNHEYIKNIELELKSTKYELKNSQIEQKKAQDELETKNAQLEERIKMFEENLIATKDDLTASNNEVKAIENDLKADVLFLKNSPFLHTCAAHFAYQSIRSQTISYSRRLYSSTNTEGGNLDMDSGIFSSPYPGSYTVTWSLLARLDAEAHSVNIYLRKNEKKIQESRHWSMYTGSSGEVQDQGGRTLILHLDRGDTLDLYCDNCEAGIFYTTFCLSLATPDIA